MEIVKNSQQYNIDYMNQIHRACRPENLRKELDDYNKPIENDRSFDDALNSTESLVRWAHRKAPQYDPENHRPISPNDSPISDYDIQFTRLNRTDQGSSSLSSLNIPMASSSSMSVLSNSTPRANALNRKSSNVPVRNGHCTPSQLIRQKQLAKIEKTGHKNSLGPFNPSSASTPIQAQRKKRSIFEELTGTSGPLRAESNARAPVEHDTLTNNRNTSTPINKTNRTLTHAKQIDDSDRTLVPDTQPTNASVIPETQDDPIPETQDDQVPASQDEFIPETQESYTQNNPATDPVQAQVSQHNKQAEPRENVSNYNRSRILSRPPIRGALTPQSPANMRPIQKTSSRIPVPKTPPRTSHINNATVTTVKVPNVLDESIRPIVTRTASPNQQQSGRTIVVITSPSRQLDHRDPPATVPATIAPTPSNMTINVNVNKSKSLPSTEIVQGPKTNTNRSRKSNKIQSNARSNRPNSSSDSLMTSDLSDSDGNRTNASHHLNTPLSRKKGDSDALNVSARRQLFAEPTNDRQERLSLMTDESTQPTFSQIESPSHQVGQTFDVITSLPRQSNQHVNTEIVPHTAVAASSSLTFDVNVNQSKSRPTNGTTTQKLYPQCTVVLSPLDADVMQKHNRKYSEAPILPPPAGFENSHRMSQFDNADSIAGQFDDDDDLIIEASPSTRDRRKTLLEQRNFEQFSPTFSRKPETEQSQASPKSSTLDVRRKKGRRKSENTELPKLPNIPLDTKRKSNPKPRRLASVDQLLNISDVNDNDNDIEQDSVITAASTSTQAKSTADDNTFKKPYAPAKKSGRKSKANNLTKNNNQTNDSIENTRANASTSRRMSQDEFEFTLQIEPINDDELRAYMSQNKTNRSMVSNQSNEQNDISDAASNQRSSRDSHQNISTASDQTETDDAVERRATSKRQPSRETHRNHDGHKQNVTSGAASNRRSSSDSRQNVSISSDQTENGVAIETRAARDTAKTRATSKRQTSRESQQKVTSGAASNRRSSLDSRQNVSTSSDQTDTSEAAKTRAARDTAKTRATSKRQTSRETHRNHGNEQNDTSNVAETRAASIRRTSRDSRPNGFYNRYFEAGGSLKRKLSTEPDIPKKNRRLEQEPPKKKVRTNPEIRRQNVQSLKSNAAKTPSTSKRSTMTKKSEQNGPPVIKINEDVMAAIAAGVDEKRLEKRRGEFWRDLIDFEKDYEIQQEDVTYIKTKKGIIETTTHKQIEYHREGGVKYGFVPSTDKRYGYMRFLPGASKPLEKSEAEIFLFVLQGLFVVRGTDGEIELDASSETTIPKDVFYEIVNTGKKTGVIQFEYAG